MVINFICKKFYIYIKSSILRNKLCFTYDNNIFVLLKKKHAIFKVNFIVSFTTIIMVSKLLEFDANFKNKQFNKKFQYKVSIL